MRSSELIWDYLEKTNQTTRGEAEHAFAYALEALLPNEPPISNGVVCDALEAAVDYLDNKDKVAEVIKEWEEVDLEIANYQAKAKGNQEPTKE